MDELGKESRKLNHNEERGGTAYKQFLGSVQVEGVVLEQEIPVPYQAFGQLQQPELSCLCVCMSYKIIRRTKVKALFFVPWY